MLDLEEKGFNQRRYHSDRQIPDKFVNSKAVVDDIDHFSKSKG